MDQSVKLTSKPNEVYKAFMPFLTDKRKSENDDLNLNIDGTVLQKPTEDLTFLCNNFATVVDEISDTEGITDLVLSIQTSVRGTDQNLGEE